MVLAKGKQMMMLMMAIKQNGKTKVSKKPSLIHSSEAPIPDSTILCDSIVSNQKVMRHKFWGNIEYISFCRLNEDANGTYTKMMDLNCAARLKSSNIANQQID